MENRRNEKSRAWFGYKVHHFSTVLILKIEDDIKDKWFDEYIKKQYGIKL